MPSASAAPTGRINHLNIGLMLASCAVALFIPFELFLFAYAVLGPAHYLTEISWLQKRQFFTPGRQDFWLLAAIAALVCFSVPWSPMTATYTFVALGGALVLVLANGLVPRIAGLTLVIVLAFALSDASGFTVLLGLFVPTLIHVYLFTGFFMIYGALKERSRSGYLAFAVFLLCPLICWLVNPGKFAPSTYAVVHYWNNFSHLNLTLLGMSEPQTTDATRRALQQVFSSPAGLAIMRCIAFAYTYHYLNWFSKTSIIRWHEMGRKRLAIIGGLWLAAVGTYSYNFPLGFKLLFYLSVTHVYLEFPLNQISIMGTFREARSRLVGELQPVRAVAARRR